MVHESEFQSDPIRQNILLIQRRKVVQQTTLFETPDSDCAISVELSLDAGHTELKPELTSSDVAVELVVGPSIVVGVVQDWRVVCSEPQWRMNGC